MTMDHTRRIPRTLRMLAVPFAFALLCAGGICAASASGKKTEKKSNDAAMMRNLTTFNAIVRELQNNYVDSIAPDLAFEEAIDGLLGTIDPYTEYYPASDRETLTRMTTGEYGGIGSVLQQKDSATYISYPLEDSPSSRAGLKAGDHVVRVDSVDVSRYTVDKTTKLLRGVPGTKVTMQVVRPYVEDSLITVEITRAKLREPGVGYYKVFPDGTGYVQLNTFIQSSADEMKAALEEMKKDPNLKSLVIDLRGNGGGLLESAVEIAGFFLPKGTEVVRTRGKDQSTERIYKTTRSPILPDILLAVLINGSSASASEILAGSIQDLDRGVLVGTRSFGKGLVQSTRPLPYDGILKVTVAKYYIPSGRLIQAFDYSHRNADGTVIRVPDSLTHAFRTLHGRTVRDGGGLTPDSVADQGNVTPLLYSLVADNWIFDYASRYAATHPEIAPAANFKVTDDIFADFRKTLDPDKIKYDRLLEDNLKKLRTQAEKEGYLSEEARAEFDTLQKLLANDFDKDLRRDRKDIDLYLGSEIVSRYYGQKGRTAYAIQDDPVLLKARGILADPALYRKILGGKK